MFDRGQEIATLGELYEIAEKHTTSHDKLVLLPMRPGDEAGQYPGQTIQLKDPRSTLIERSLEAKPFDEQFGPLGLSLYSDYSVIEGLARSVDRRFPFIAPALDGFSVETDNAAEKIKAGDSIINGTDHAELIDIALWHLAFSERVKNSETLIDHPNRGFKTGIVVSKMVDFLGIDMGLGDPIPARYLLALAFDYTFMVIPRKPEYDTDVLDGFNAQSKAQTSKALQGYHPRKKTRRSRQVHTPLSLGVALPGTVNKPLRDDPETMVIGRVSDGISDYTGQSHVLTIATALRFGDDEARIFISGSPRHIEDNDDITSLMHTLLDGIVMLDGRKHVYDETGELRTAVQDEAQDNLDHLHGRKR